MSDYFLNKIYNSLLSNKPVPKKPEPIVEKKETFKPLSKVYEVLVREKVDHRAVYSSKDTVDPNNVPDRTEQGLETVGVVSDEVVKRIKKQVGFETTDIASQVRNIIEKNGIGDKKGRAYSALYNALEASEIDANRLLQILTDTNNPGTFNILTSGRYNCITAALQSIQNHPLAKNNQFNNDALRNLLLNVLPLDPQFASTNVGPGELYFIIFSNGTTGGEKGSKSGDVQLGEESIEIKATGDSGARLGGTDQIREGYKYILKQLEQDYKYIPSVLITVSKALKEIQNLIQTVKTTVNNKQKTPEAGFEDIKNGVNEIIKRYSRVEFKLNPSNTITKNFNKGANSIYDRVKRGGIPGASFKNSFFIDYFEAEINKKVADNEQEINDFKKITRDSKHLTEGNLDEFLYGILSILQSRPNVTTESIIDYISQVNNYSPEYVKKDLQELFANKMPEQIISEYAGGSLIALNKLIGAMHLLSYTKEIKCTKYLLVNSKNGETFTASAPTNLKEAIDIVSASGVNISTSFDRPSGSKTNRAKSVNIEYYG